MIGNGNNVIGNYQISSNGIPAYYVKADDAHYRVNCSNSIKSSFLFRINGTSFDLRYVLMRSAAPTKYSFSDEHYRIEFKDATLEYPCTVDNIIVHEGFSMYFEWFLNESVEWKWRSLKPEQKQSKKKQCKQSSKKQSSRTQPKHTSAREKRQKTSVTSRKTNPKVSSVAVAAVNKSLQVKTAAPAQMKKTIKLMSTTKFEELKFKMRLNVTTTKQERQMYQEQCVLRKLKKFEKRFA